MAHVLVDIDMPDGSTDRIRIDESVAEKWQTPPKEGEDRPTCRIVDEKPKAAAKPAAQRKAVTDG